jgi:hypothetical protein
MALAERTTLAGQRMMRTANERKIKMETIKEIANELRHCHGLNDDDLQSFADRIEAAAKRAVKAIDNKEETCKSFHNRTSYSVQFSHDKIRWEDMLDTFSTADEAKQWGIKHRSINSKIYNDWLIRVIAITTRTEVVYGNF